MTLYEGLTLIVALGAALFAAKQSTAAENALDQAREAAAQANATSEAMNQFQQRHVAVQLILEEFKSSFANDCQSLIRELNMLTASIEESIGSGSWNQSSVSADWMATRTKIRTLKQAARQCSAIDQTEQLQCFVSEPYDGVATSFNLLINAPDTSAAQQIFDGVERSVAVFISALQSLCNNARANILTSLYDQ